MISGTALLVIFIGILTLYLFSRKEKRNLPPGPFGLPLIGNLHQLGKSPYVPLAKWANKYGDLYRIYLGSNVTVVINDYKLSKEMLSTDAYTGRMNMTIVDLFDDGSPHGVIGREGELWEQLRRFTLRQLRDFGFGKNTMESYITNEVDETMKWFRSQNGKPIDDVKEQYTLAVVNSLWTIISGTRYEHGDSVILKIVEQGDRLLKIVAGKGGFLFFAPWIRHIIPGLSGHTEVRQLMAERVEFFKKFVSEHKKTYSDDFSRDFMDVFIKEMKETKDPNSAFYGAMGEKEMLSTIVDLFGAGSDTTSITLAWTCLYLSVWPEAQEKLHEEIKAITLNNRDCSLADRPNMPYTLAVIQEVLRYSSLLPVVLLRSIKETEVRGYTIPKDSIIMMNSHFVHFNPKIWGDPMNFRPERFLSADGKTFIKSDTMTPFSIGRRQCLGETLARDTLFLFTTATFQKFQVKLYPSGAKPDLQPQMGPVLRPKPFQVTFTDRLGAKNAS